VNTTALGIPSRTPHDFSRRAHAGETHVHDYLATFPRPCMVTLSQAFSAASPQALATCRGFCQEVIRTNRIAQWLMDHSSHCWSPTMCWGREAISGTIIFHRVCNSGPHTHLRDGKSGTGRGDLGHLWRGCTSVTHCGNQVRKGCPL